MELRSPAKGGGAYSVFIFRYKKLLAHAIIGTQCCYLLENKLLKPMYDDKECNILAASSLL